MEAGARTTVAEDVAPAPGPPGPGPARTLLRAAGTALVVLVGALLLGGAAPQVVDGVAAAPATVRWLVPVADLLGHLAALMAAGCLLCAALLPRTERGGVLPAATAWSSAWAASALAGAALTAADEGGASRPVRALAATAALAALLAVLARRGRVRTALALVPPVLAPAVLTGHAAAGPVPGVAVPAVLVHVSAAVLWAGGLAALVVHVRCGRALVLVLPRLSRVALVCTAALVVSGATAAALHLSAAAASWSGGWARLLAVKTVLLLALVGVGAAHRARTLPMVAAGRPGAFTALARGELLVLVAAVAVAAALSRAPG